MNGSLLYLEPDFSEFVEVDPTGRYGRYKEILGKGASKTVYRAFDEYEGIEVAWNQVKLYDFLQSPEDLERLYCEIHLLKTLKHKNIMKFYTSWVDTDNRNINFITEMFTSGTLRQFRLKHKRVNIRAVKHWCRQILRGLLYLHSHDPPIIHRDLKCDNIFVNGNQGEVKIGDLGLAAILRKSHAAHCVGTPEFMAPEVYEEEYNELVDIYSFGMCILEMVTFEYPYSECNHPAQIYKKVISGKRPDALYNVRDPEVRQFVEKCLATVSSRLSARELLKDPFLQTDDCESDSRSLDSRDDFDVIDPILRQSSLDYSHANYGSYSNGFANGAQNMWEYHNVESEPTGIELFETHDEEHSSNVNTISIKGKRRGADGIFLRLRIADKEGRIRNIYFPFDIESDTALSVATEMVTELDIMDQDVSQIADMIDGEIASLVPGWRMGPEIEDSFANIKLCLNCASTHTSCGSLMEYLTKNPGAMNFHCNSHGCGRFEEVTYQVENGHHLNEGGAPQLVLSHSLENLNYNEIWDTHEISDPSSSLTSSDEEHENLEKYFSADEDSNTGKNKEISMQNDSSISTKHSLQCDLTDDCQDEIQHGLRWVKAKYQREMVKIREQELGIDPKLSKSCYSGSLLPLSLHRTTSLPVDAVDL